MCLLPCLVTGRPRGARCAKALLPPLLITLTYTTFATNRCSSFVVNVMGFGVVGLVVLCVLPYVCAHSFYPGGFGYFGFRDYPESFGHGHFQSPKAYPPLPKKKFTIADELKYGPKFNPRPFPKPYGGFPRFPGFSGFFPVDEEFFASTGTGSTPRPQATSSGSGSVNRVMVQASVSVAAGSGGATTTTTQAPPGATTEDEDKVVPGAPDRCPSGQQRNEGECRDVA